MNTNVIKNENCTFEVSAAVDKEIWQEAQKKAFQKIKATLKLKGFRDGKSIPDALAKPHIEIGNILNEAINVVLPETFEAVLKEHNIVPFMQPDVNVTKVSDTEVEFVFSIPLYPEVELGKYKDITVEKKAVSVTEEEISNAISQEAVKTATLRVFEGAARMGDTVVFDFVGYTDGKAFDGGSAKDYALELGSNQFVPGFEEQLVGVKAGEDKEIKVVFPTQYVKELAGKEAIFKCHIIEVKEKILPEVDDEFAKSLNIPEVETLEALRASKHKEIEANKTASAEQENFNTVLGMIADDAKVQISEKAILREVEAMKKDLTDKIAQNGLDLEQYLEITNTKIEALEEQLKKEATHNLKTYLALSKIAEVEHLNITDTDVEAEFENMSKQYNMPIEKIKEILGANIDNMKQSLQQKKIEDFIRANNKF
ncbi:MAG: trigger factor [Bacilli bacterium]